MMKENGPSIAHFITVAKTFLDIGLQASLENHNIVWLLLLLEIYQDSV